MTFVTPEEFAQRLAEEAQSRADEQMREEQRERDAYTWENARSDLAYGTPLTIFDAGRVTRTLEEEDTGLHPYDALPLLVKIFGDPDPLGGVADPARSERYEQMAWNMAKMIRQAMTPINATKED